MGKDAAESQGRGGGRSVFLHTSSMNYCVPVGTVQLPTIPGVSHSPPPRPAAARLVPPVRVSQPASPTRAAAPRRPRSRLPRARRAGWRAPPRRAATPVPQSHVTESRVDELWKSSPRHRSRQISPRAARAAACRKRPKSSGRGGGVSESTRRGRPCQEKCRAGGHTARWRAYREGPRRF